jgi:hypothetical protein
MNLKPGENPSMPCTPFRISALALVLLLLSGCGGSAGGSGGSGGGNGGGGGTPTTVTFTITGATPTAVATQIGSGQFTAATLTSGKLTLSLPSGTANFAVAFVCPPYSSAYTGVPLQTIENVYEASTLDGTSFSYGCPESLPTVTTGTLTGTVDASAIPGASTLYLFAQGASQRDEVEIVSASPFSLAVPAGTDRVLVLAVAETMSNFDQVPVAARNFNGVAVPGALNDGNTVVLGAADEVTQEAITYSGVPSGFNTPATTVTYLMAGQVGGGVPILADSAVGQYPALPAGAMQSGDYYSFTTILTNPAGSQMAVFQNSTTGGPLSVAFPAAWSYAGPTPAALPAFDLAYSGFSGNTGVIDSAILTWPLTGATQSVLQVFATGDYLNGSTTLAVPNFSSLTGFLAPPASATQVSWVATIDQGSYPSFQQPIPANSTTTTVSNSGTYTVP